jgi:hypothetical protein
MQKFPLSSRAVGAGGGCGDAPELLASFRKFGFEVMIKRQGEVEAFVVSEAERWPPIVSAAGLRPE